MIKHYKYKNNQFQAIQWNGTNLVEIQEYLGSFFVSHEQERRLHGKNNIKFRNNNGTIQVVTINDYIIKDFTPVCDNINFQVMHHFQFKRFFEEVISDVSE